LVIRSVEGDQVTVILTRREPTDREKSMREFLDKWSGAFGRPENIDAGDDPRLAYLIDKHVK